MTNDEVQNNSHTEKQSDFVFDLPYDKTQWGRFYESYKSMGQLQIQKFLEKTWNLLTKKRTPPEKRSFVKSVFYETEYDANANRKITPKILLKEKTRGYSDSEWVEKHIKQTDVLDVIYTKLIYRMTLEYAEVVAYYQEQKNYLEFQHNEKKKEHAKTTIECPHCKASITRTNLAKHKKTNKKCIEIQNGRGE